MKALHIIPYIGAESSGPAYSAPALCAAIKNMGVEVELHVLAPKPQRDFNFKMVDYPRHCFPTPRVGRSPEMREGVYSSAKTADVIHNHSLWMCPNIYGAGAITRLMHQGLKAPKLVCAPRGTMTQWALRHHSFNKWLFDLFAHQWSAMKMTDMWHVTAKAEYEDIRRLGFHQPVALIPNGIDFINTNVTGRCNRRRLFFLSRIHPQKKLSLAIECWAKLEKDFPEWDFSVVGPDKDNSYADEMKKLVAGLGCKRVRFEGELSGESKYRFMAESELQVFPTFSENFGMVVAESLACGTPVIASKGAPWKGLEIHGCGRWVKSEEGEFLDAMREMMSKSRDELSAMGARGKEWMERDFSWCKIGEHMRSAYEWLCDHADKPDCVILD